MTRFAIYFLTALLSFTLNLTSVKAAPPQRNTAIIHILIAADTKDRNIGDGVQADLLNLKDLFETSIAETQLDLKTIDGDRVTRDDILRTINNFNCRPNDAMVFFWSGHGAHDNQGHYIVTRTSPLYRTEIMDQVKKRGGILSAVISDSCNVYVPGELVFHKERAYAVKVPGTALILDQLFLKSQGSVDINGAKEGECSFCDPEKNGGGTFLSPFVDVVRGYEQQRLDWPKFIEILRPKVQEAFERTNPQGFKLPDGQIQRTQTVRIWGDLPKSVINQGQVASLVSLERGDIILAVNGQPIRGKNECIQAVQNSQQSIELRVRDTRNGIIRNLHGELLPPEHCTA